jgi:hypothetical protein
MANDLNTNADFLYTLAAKEAGWTGDALDHNLPLNNPFGVNIIKKGQAAGNKKYASLDDPIKDWEKLFGNRVSGKNTADDFIAGLLCKGGNCNPYNVANPNYESDYKNVYKSVLKYKETCGCK